MLTIFSRVCVDFRSRSGESIFTIEPDRRFCFMKAPDSIREDPIFDMLIADGSLEVTEERAMQKKLEADPMEGIAPDGKRAQVVASVKGKTPEKKAAVKKDQRNRKENATGTVENDSAKAGGSGAAKADGKMDAVKA